MVLSVDRPDWCPQRVWDDVVKCNAGPSDDRRVSFARAILAAEQREREACAQVAAKFATTSNTRDVHLVMQEAASADTAEGIAAAIRSRTGDENGEG